MSSKDNPSEGSDSSRTDTDEQTQTNTDDAATNGIIAAANADGDFTDEFKPDTDADEVKEREQARSDAIDKIRATIDDLVNEFNGSIPETRAALLLSDELDCEHTEARDIVLDHATIENGDVTGSKSGFAHIVNRDETDGDAPLPWSQIEWLYGATPGDFPEGQMQKQSDINAEAREELAEKLDEEYHWMFLVDEEQGIEEFRVYEPESGIYEKGAKRKLGRIMRRKIGGKADTKEVNEVADWLQAFNETELDEIEAGDEPLRCFTNGVLNYETWDFTPQHSPEHMFVRRVDSRWDENVDTSIVRDFLEDITSREEDAKVIAELMGDALVDHYDRQWFGIIYGPGSNGKSVLLSALRQVLGSENVTGESLHDIAETRWSSQRLVGGAGAFANIDPDISARKITDAGAIKNNTGGDSTAHEQKGQDKFDAVNKAKMLFGANEPCVFEETKRSIKRRIKPIELEYEYLPEDEVDEDDPMQKVRDTELEDKLTTDDARAAWVQVMAEGLQRLQENGAFSFPESQDELFEQYQKASDPIQVFLRDMVRNEPVCWTDTGNPVYMTYQELYNMYTNMCNDMNETVATSKTFGSELKKQSIVEMEPYYPGEIDSQHAKRYIVPTQKGWQYTGTSVKERFAMRTDHVDIDPPTSDDESNSESDDEDDEHERDAEGAVMSAITRLNKQNDSQADLRSILDHCRGDQDLPADVLDAIDSLEESGRIEEDSNGVFHVNSDDSDEDSDSDDPDVSEGDDTADADERSEDDPEGVISEKDRTTVARHAWELSDGTMTGVSRASLMGSLHESDVDDVDAVIESLDDDGIFYTNEDGSKVGMSLEIRDFLGQ